eukprot:TRINITY_DN1982_c0_g1_i1.p1 TRINITY_DN1982_c0_g1~~TRINITY_DN1982_c0_g1_i1.p1  ORF type:complete len:701 (-),score=236.58 TRINITY_DN1982_c0_g1_i1:946-2982(-)
MGDAAALFFKGIGIQGHTVGSVKFSDEGIMWASSDRSSQQKVLWSKAEKATWAVFGKYAHLRMFMKDPADPPVRFDGFQRADFDRLKEALAAHSIKLSRDKVNSGGGNYGEFKIEGGMLQFVHGDKKQFDISMKQISQCVLPGNKKGNNDVELQLHETDTMDNNTEDCLVEMRLYLPDESEDEDGMEVDEDGEAIRKKDKKPRFTAETFHQAVMDRANIRDVKGSVLCELDSSLGTFLTPRGRYALEMYSTFLRMHGSKYDYKIQYEDINKLFLLEKPDDRYVAFVISLDKPVRQGQQRYQHLVLQASKVEETLNLNMSEAELQEKYKGALEPVMRGALCNLIAKIFKSLSGRAVFVTGNYRSAAGAKCVKCAMGASEGHLYPLNKSFIFIHKPTRVIGFDEVESVEFQRYSGTQDPSTVRRSFDLCVTLRSISGEPSKDYTFSGIDRSEYPSLYQWCQTKNLRIKNIKSSGDKVASALAEAMDSADVREEGEIKRVKSAQAVANGGGGESDESSEEDADYAPPSQSEPEASGSEGEGSGAEGGKPKEKAPKKKKKEKRAPAPEAKGSSDESDSAGDSDGDKKPKAKAPKSTSKPEAGKRKAPAAPAAGKKKRKKKDPNAPKGAKSAFMYFSMETRGDVLKDQPGLKITEVSKVLGERSVTLRVRLVCTQPLTLKLCL